MINTYEIFEFNSSPQSKFYFPKVRGAAVFSLGTFVSSLVSHERTDHARAIDHTIAITLANTVTHDGSPLVRRVRKIHFFIFSKI